ncbi:hypothetical protein KIN34_15640 [Cellulomonas sp. DKR-3]|uniref:Uncharacterized protein n=1 Tax=Cellulomonas fulva TaxID=2835530 RepID=A0ABS5U2W6_9CELL|nr:hypothetical protein [Cellulomonas fulva]MBT0995712.1 hypothetical protein [Cellulomonas fulva]
MTTSDRMVSMSTVEPMPRRRLDRADLAAVVVAWAGVGLGLVAKLAFAGWVLVVIFVFFLLTIVLPLVGAYVVQRALLGTGQRRISDRTRPWYRAFGWATGTGVFLAYACVVDGGDVEGDEHSLLMFLSGGSATPDWVQAAVFPVWAVGVGAAAAAIVLYLVERTRARRAVRAAGGAV